MAKAFIEYTEEEVIAMGLGSIFVSGENATDARWDYPWEWA